MKNEPILPQYLYSGNFREYKKEISIELQTLLPAFNGWEAGRVRDAKTVDVNGSNYQTVQAILPVLVAGYMQNRRGDPNWKKEGKDYPRGTAMIYANLVQIRKLDSLYHSKQNLDGIFRLRPWSKKYSKLRYDQITSENMRTKLNYFGHIILFLFLTYKMKDFCNLSMSCALFEYFSGFIGYFDNFFLHVESDYNFKRLSDDPQKGEIISYLRKMFDKDIDPSERAIWWNILLNNYVVFVINEVARREGKKYEESFSEGKWAGNKWVAEFISSLPDLSWLQAYCPYDNEFVDDSLYQMLKINSYFESEEGKKSISKLHRIYCNRESKQIKKLRGNGPYTVMAVRPAKITRPMIRIKKSILRKNNTKNANMDKICTWRYVIKPAARWLHRQKRFAQWKYKILRHPELINIYCPGASHQKIESLKKAAKRLKHIYRELSEQKDR